jgi:hypothetical protein
MTLSPPQRLFFVQEQVIGPAIINFVLNGLIAWLVFRAQAQVPLWGDQSIVADVTSTLFILPLLTCLITTPLVQRAVATGKLAPVSWKLDEHVLLRRLPKGVFARAALLGGITALALSPVVIATLLLLNVHTLPVVTFAVSKGLFCSVVAVAVTPLAALYALAQASTLQTQEV